jgi:hypothetical protein
MGLMDNIRDRLLGWLLPEEYMNDTLRERMENYSLWQQYYQGNYRKQLRVKPLQADDNIGLNFSGLVVDRSISMLLGNGIEFDFGDNTVAQDHINAVWDANKANILLHKAAQYAGIYGTGYLKIIPEGTEARASTENILLPRLVAIDPYWIRIETMPEDIEMVSSYTTRFNVAMDGMETARKETIERVMNEEGLETLNWYITNYKSNRATSGRWEVISEEDWPYEFPPIIHWQNLPQPSDTYGQSDIEDIVELQDRINFTASNISKIIRYHAHPKTWGRGISNPTKTSWGADEMLQFQGDNASIQNLEMQSDLASSQQYLMELRQALFDISRTVDITSVADKLGSLTNFGLRVLFLDALNKIGTKQQLLGEALIELNHRLLTLDGIQHNDGGEIIWPDPLPSDELAETSALAQDINLGLVSKRTASLERGYDYDKEQEQMKEEKSGEENLGSMLLNAFNKGQ